MKRFRPRTEPRARQHDFVENLDPAYEVLLGRILEEVGEWPIEDGASLLDLGAGTGRLSLRLAAAFPHATVIHLDPDAEKNNLAAESARERWVENITFLCRDLAVASHAPGSLAGLVTVHTLFTLENPGALIRRIHRWLRPGGMLLACDIGRPIDPSDMKRHLKKALRRRHGLLRSPLFSRHIHAAIRRYQAIEREQLAGRYWTHSLGEFRAAFEEVGFTVLKDFSAYRKLSDIVVARR